MMRSRSGAVRQLACIRVGGSASLARVGRGCQRIRCQIRFHSRELTGSSPARRRARAELDALRARNLHRRLRRVEGRQAPRMRVDGRDCLMLAGSNYLDLAGDARVIAAAQRAAAEYGTAAGRLAPDQRESRAARGRSSASSRASPATRPRSCSAPATWRTSACSARSCGPDDVIVSDSLNHASIIDACKLSRAETRVFRHNDPEDFARVAVGARRLPPPRAGRRRRVQHGRRRGAARASSCRSRARTSWSWCSTTRTASACSARTAAASPNAAACRVDLRDRKPRQGARQLRRVRRLLGDACASSCVNAARSFIFTCALAPPALGAAREALRIVASRARAPQAPARARGAAARRAARGRLRHRREHDADRARDRRRERCGDALCEAALERGVYAQGIRHPSVPHGSARIRFTPTLRAHGAATSREVVRLFAELRVRWARSARDEPHARAARARPARALAPVHPDERLDGRKSRRDRSRRGQLPDRHRRQPLPRRRVVAVGEPARPRPPDPARAHPRAARQARALDAARAGGRAVDRAGGEAGRDRAARTHARVLQRQRLDRRRGRAQDRLPVLAAEERGDARAHALRRAARRLPRRHARRGRGRAASSSSTRPSGRSCSTCCARRTPTATAARTGSSSRPAASTVWSRSREFSRSTATRSPAW